MEFPDPLSANHPEARGKRFRVFLDGNEIKMVKQASISGGWADVLACRPDGRPVVNGDELLTERLSGEITIEEIKEEEPR